MSSPTPTELRRNLLLATYENYTPTYDYTSLVADIRAANMSLVCFARFWPVTGDTRIWFVDPADLGLSSAFLAFSKLYSEHGPSLIDPDYSLVQIGLYPVIPAGIQGLFDDDIIIMSSRYVLEEYIISALDLTKYEAYLDTTILNP